MTEKVPRGLCAVRGVDLAVEDGEVSGSQIEQLVDEPILLANIIVADPPRLPLADHVHRLVSLLSFAELRGTRESSAWPSLAV